MDIAFVFYSDNAMSDDAILVSIENDVANFNRFRFDGFNGDHIFVQDGGIHAVAGGSKTNAIPRAKKIGTNLCKIKLLCA